MNPFDEISSRPALHARYEAAPLRREREQYLVSMLKRGVKPINVQVAATYLLHIVRLLKMTSLRKVGLKEIEVAGRKWAARQMLPSRNQPGSPFTFVHVAKSWLRFHGQFSMLLPCRFQREIEGFAESLRMRGRSIATVEKCADDVLRFLRWFGNRHQSLKSVSLRSIDEFLALKRQQGWSVGTLARYAGTLRGFFRYAELRRWCAPGLALGIPRMQRRRSDNRLKGPTWAEVRKLIRSASGSSPSELRARAIILLFAIYGLRSSEVAQFRLSDFDWYSETFTVRRAKRGGTQQFPIQYEVGEAIIRYLLHGRPTSSTDFAFVTFNLRHGRINAPAMWQLVSRRMLALGIRPEKLGPHSLRRACATRLLKKGTSLREIANFLGHRNIRTVSTYARLDTRLLRKVASFSMAGVL